VKISAGDRVGDYRVLDEIPGGGMGRIFRVQNLISGRIDAMKVLLPGLPEEARAEERFLREIQVLAGLEHPNITALRTATRVEDLIVMIMEYVDGTTLEKRLEGGPVPLQESLDYIRQTALGLSYAHERGVVHRDIKPSNIMITPQGKVKLMDFGIAKVAADQRLTRTGLSIGSVHYMSPEQIQDRDVDQRSDVYSLGIVLYEVTTGKKPYDAEYYLNIVYAHLQGEPVPPVGPGIPPTLTDVILKAMAKDPSERYQTAKQFLEALDAVKLRAAEQANDNADRVGEGFHAAPKASKSEAPSSRSQAMYKLLAPLFVGAVLITLLVLLLYHAYSGYKSPHSGSGSIRAPFLSLKSGDMVLVVGGEALLGARPERKFVGSFYIDKTEVTNRAFLDFCHATGHPLPPKADQAPADYPVVNVTFDDALPFCGWAGKRLPTADEWEKAARGPTGQLYPWGDSFNYSFANIPRDESAVKTAKLASAMDYELGKSPCGALNMLGNAWEWVNAEAHAPAGEEFREYQQIFRDLDPPLSATEPFYYARGGAYDFFLPVDKTPALLGDPGSPLPARARKPDVGFRCAMDAKN
jgi:serine/threonine-protein kinase